MLALPGALSAALAYYRAMFDPTKADPTLGGITEACDRPISVPTLAPPISVSPVLEEHGLSLLERQHLERRIAHERSRTEKPGSIERHKQEAEAQSSVHRVVRPPRPPRGPGFRRKVGRAGRHRAADVQLGRNRRARIGRRCEGRPSPLALADEHNLFCNPETAALHGSHTVQQRIGFRPRREIGMPPRHAQALVVRRQHRVALRERQKST
jgi:hypothetical protein